MEHIRWQAERGCAFWQREPGADFDANGASQSLRFNANDSR
jgi:hypothetical protein